MKKLLLGAAASIALLAGAAQAQQAVNGPGVSYIPNSAALGSSGGTLNGNLLFSPDNTYNIGANGANRPNSIFAASAFFLPPTAYYSWINDGGVTATANGTFQFANSGASNTFTLTTAGSNLAAFNGTVGAPNFQANSTGLFYWGSRAQLTSPADGQFKCTNNAGTAACSVIGTTTNDNAVAGGIGEYICAQVTNGGSPTGCATNTATAVTLTTATPATITSLSLTAGDWEVCASINFAVSGTTTVSAFSGGISTTAATLPTAPGGGGLVTEFATFTVGQVIYATVGCVRESFATTTTTYLVGQMNFAVASAVGGGFIGARRMR